MSDNEQKDENRKTVDNILAEMERESIIHVCIPAIDLERYVKRIKEAWKRERAKVEADALAVGGIVEAARMRTAEKSSAVGNAAAMRDALVAVKKSIDDIGASSLDCDQDVLMMSLTQVCARLSSKIEVALAAPARVCDVNTLELLSDFVEKTILTSDLLKNTHEIVNGIVMASVRTALTIAYAPTKSEGKQRKGENDGR